MEASGDVSSVFCSAEFSSTVTLLQCVVQF